MENDELLQAIEAITSKTDKRFSELTLLLEKMQDELEERDFNSVYGFVIKVILAAVLLYAMYQCAPTVASYFKDFGGNVVQSSLIMNQTEYSLLQSATELIADDMESYESIGTALSALYAELPTTIRDKVIDKLGTVKDTSALTTAMTDLVSRIVVSDTTPDKPVEAIVLPSENQQAILPDDKKEAIEPAPVTPKQISRKRLFRRR